MRALATPSDCWRAIVRFAATLLVNPGVCWLMKEKHRLNLKE